MASRDGGKVSRSTLAEMRIRAVRQVEAGVSPEAVIADWGFSRPRIYEWLTKSLEGGLDALRMPKTPGKAPKPKGLMVRWLYNAITMKSRIQFKFPLTLWTRGMIGSLILDLYGVQLSQISVGRLLAKLGLTCQRPIFRVTEQNRE